MKKIIPVSEIVKNHGEGIRDYFCGHPTEVSEIIGKTYGIDMRKHLIVESVPRMENIVVVSDELAIKAISRWFNALDKEKKKQVAITLKGELDDNMHYDALELWRDEMEGIMSHLGSFVSTDYTLDLYVVFEHFITSTPEYTNKSVLRGFVDKIVAVFENLRSYAVASSAKGV